MADLDPTTEQRVRSATDWADTYHRRFVEIEPPDARTLLGELDRLRAVEQAAADFVRAGLCGNYANGAFDA